VAQLHITFFCQFSQSGAKFCTLQYKHNIGGASPALLSFHFVAVFGAVNVDRKIRKNEFLVHKYSS